MALDSFGYTDSFNDLIDKEAFFIETLKSLPKLSSSDAKLVLKDLYETKYGIFNHRRSDKSPFSSVLFHESESRFHEGLLRSLIADYLQTKVKDFTGLTLLEYLSLPSHLTKVIMKAVDVEKQREAKMLDDAKNALNNASR